MQKKIIFNLVTMIIICGPLSAMIEEEDKPTEKYPLTMIMDSREQDDSDTCWEKIKDCGEDCWENTQFPCRNFNNSCLGITKCLCYSCLFTAYCTVYGYLCLGGGPTGGN